MLEKHRCTECAQGQRIRNKSVRIKCFFSPLKSPWPVAVVSTYFVLFFLWYWYRNNWEVLLETNTKHVCSTYWLCQGLCLSWLLSTQKAGLWQCVLPVVFVTIYWHKCVSIFAVKGNSVLIQAGSWWRIHITHSHETNQRSHINTVPLLSLNINKCHGNQMSLIKIGGIGEWSTMATKTLKTKQIFIIQ